jgi:hypothetical protein
VTCPSSEEIAALFDRSLPKKRADRIRNHLATCHRCCNDFKVLSKSLQELGSSPQAPAGLIKAILQRQRPPLSSIKSVRSPRKVRSRRTNLIEK